MPYSEELAARIGNVLASRNDVVQKKMFGGIAFMLNGNMACGVVRNDLMVRVGAEGHDEAISQPYAREMDFTGRPMKGMIYVAAEGIQSESNLRSWIDRGIAFASSLPSK